MPKYGVSCGLFDSKDTPQDKLEAAVLASPQSYADPIALKELQGSGDFLAVGGDNYSVFTQGTNRHVGEIDLDAFARYIEDQGTIDPGPQDRITAAP